MMKKILLLPVLFLVACGSPGDRKRTVHIESEPKGARVFFGSGATENDAERTRSFLGLTPLDWVTVATDEGEFPNAGGIIFMSEFVPNAFVFYAEPPSGQTNLFKQKQVFHGGTQFKSGDKIPEGVFFDLTQPQPTNSPSGKLKK